MGKDGLICCQSLSEFIHCLMSETVKTRQIMQNESPVLQNLKRFGIRHFIVILKTLSIII